MKIAVNTRLLLPGKLDGIGWFTYHTIKRITENNPGVEFIFFFDRPWSEEFIFSSNIQPVVVSPQARHPFLYYLWFELAVPSQLMKHKADMFLSPDGYLSLSTDIKQLPVIHDLNFEHYPKDLPWLTRNYYLHYFPKFAQKASRIATVSEFSKADIVNNYKITPEKIDVVYNGVNDLYIPIDDTQKRNTKIKYSKGVEYFLFVGMLHQRKNIANLFRAFELFKSSDAGAVKLIIVGNKKWWTDEMENVYSNMQFKDDVIFTGRLPIEELIKVTGAALSMVYVSVFEGFGVPIIEAMKCGVPVITGNVTSMPEVSGDAAILVDPFNVNSIAEAMQKVYSDEQLRFGLIKKGFERSNEFSWNKSAELLWQSLVKCIDS